MSMLKIMAIAGSMLFAMTAMAAADQTSAAHTTTASESAKTGIQAPKELTGEDKMQFGNFSVSLAVKDIKASKTFYEKLDFRHVFGSLEQDYVIMQNGTTTIGLFQGMFEKNILTFNPGWNHKAETLEQFQDVRDLQTTIKERGITPVLEADAATSGPTSFMIVDPDGNSILVDQHVPKSK